jgi:hypothetical protein
VNSAWGKELCVGKEPCEHRHQPLGWDLLLARVQLHPDRHLELSAQVDDTHGDPAGDSSRQDAARLTVRG